ncbi:glycosyltransferase [Treponema sp. OMZ 792]|uniref:glycosyltransferase n=1 Tax=Treponema sp. OMZ 792 TaxID=2563667 RepID=UPI0020A2CF5F|nr:glycosyltransferase [Treponema sp. OMZ 792]
MNKITVLMPSYNRGRYITEAVNSVLNQKTKFGVKLIITDDCSTDGSVEKIKDFHKTHPDNIEIILSGKNERLLSNILKAQMRVETEYFVCWILMTIIRMSFFYKKLSIFLILIKSLQFIVLTV